MPAPGASGTPGWCGVRRPGAPGERRRLRAALLGAALLGAGWLAASPPAVAQSPETAGSAPPDARFRAVHGAVLTGLQAMPELDPRAVGALALGGRCAAATPCRTESTSAIATAPPLQVSTIACEVTLAFDGRTLLAATIEGLGRGATCETARRDAPMQVAARLLPALQGEVLDWSRKRRLDELADTLETLDRGTARMAPPEAVTDAPDKTMKAMDEALRAMDQK